MAYEHWTADEIDTLKQMWGDGHSFTSRQIADELGRTRGAVMGAISRFALPKRGSVRETTNYPATRKPRAPLPPKPIDFERPNPAEPTKSELKAMFAQAWANTAKM